MPSPTVSAMLFGVEGVARLPFARTLTTLRSVTCASSEVSVPRNASPRCSECRTWSIEGAGQGSAKARCIGMATCEPACYGLPAWASARPQNAERTDYQIARLTPWMRVLHIVLSLWSKHRANNYPPRSRVQAGEKGRKMWLMDGRVNNLDCARHRPPCPAPLHQIRRLPPFESTSVIAARPLASDSRHVANTSRFPSPFSLAETHSTESLGQQGCHQIGRGAA